MIDPRDLRQLRGQLMMVAALFSGSLCLAISLLVARPMIEESLCETYAIPQQKISRALRESFAKARAGSLTLDEFALLPEGERRYLFYDWMLAKEIHQDEPRCLVDLDAKTFLRLAETSVIAGNTEQKEKAIEFLKLAGHARVPLVLQSLEAWANRRKKGDLATKLGAAWSQIEEQGPR